ncbi:MAG: hypothetical protein KDC67_12645, partial [Ignavibacteriae bacterium]|nr:hypothetical protein [Ignavibacteriota bacterium]
VVELFEKIIRIRKFIKTAYEEDKRESDRELYKLYNQALSFISSEISDFCKVIVKNSDEGEIFDNMLFIDEKYKSVIKIHEDLKNISSIKILPEIKSFLSELDSEEEKLNKFNLILTDNYSFKERNLGKKILKDLNDKYQKTPNINNTHTFILPKIEFSNPLNWSILVHEYGHLVLENESDSFISKFESQGDKLNSSDKQLVRQWVEELYCDVFAAKHLGPAYLVSFLSINLLNSFDCSHFSNSHPSAYLRAENIKSFLRKYDADFSSSSTITNYGKLLNEAMLNIGKTCNKILNQLPSSQSKINETNILRTFRAYISEKNLMNLNTSYSNENIKSIELLLEKLKKGLPIGTIRKPLDAKLIKDLDKDSHSISLDDINNWKNASIERPTTHWEILNTGWIYKIEHIKTSNLFFSDFDSNIQEKLDEYAEHIDKLDDILLHSISSSQIIKSIEK